MPSARIPRFTAADARRLAAEGWGLAASAQPLPSYRDQNFLLEAAEGERFVLKIANADVSLPLLDLENRVMEHLARCEGTVPCPRVRPTAAGEEVVEVPAQEGAVHLARLLTYLPGTRMADAHPHTPALLEDLGQALGALDGALEGLSHPAMERDFPWDVRQVGWIGDHLEIFDRPERRALVERFLARHETAVVPALPLLRWSLIHNDANDYNVLVGYPGGGRKEVVGLVDFGDLIHTVTAAEPAIAAAYAMLGKVDPLAVAAHLVRGYHRVHPLTEDELALLFDLIALRLCITVTMSALETRRGGGDGYLTVSEAPAWSLLERLAETDPALATYTFREACGLVPCPRQPAVTAWLAEHATDLAPIVEPDPATAESLVVDLSPGSLELAELPPDADAAAWEGALHRRLAAAGAALGLGRWNEARIAAGGPCCARDEDGGPAATIHLGVDLFLPRGTPVFAPLAGTVHGLPGHASPAGDGPTLILEHRVDGDLVFYTLYGHLSGASLEGLTEGREIEAGGKVGEIGDPQIDGGGVPHLHFQLVLDPLGRRGDFPWLAAPERRRLWTSLSPDPNLLLRVPEQRFPPPPARGAEILERRRRTLGPSLSVSYRRPLTLVRGRGSHLWDDGGRRYLDAVNNVAHVGHCHPKVVAAERLQSAVLNTNTRYLHENLVRYAEELTARLPEPLSVCYLVCSGSEANELALRLARAHTGASGVVTVDGAYHGNTTSLVDISPYKFDGPGGSGPPPHVVKVSMPDPYRGAFPASDPQAGEKYAAEVGEAAAVLGDRGCGASAFICESLLSCGGQIVLPEGYLAAAYRWAREAGAVAIADEVQVGLGRVGSRFWGFETQGVVPDIVTLGKPIGNGHPLAAVITTRQIAASFANGMEYFNTFGGNPVSCAIGRAVLEVIEEEGLQVRALAVGRRLQAALEELRERFPLVGDVRGLGLFLGVELVRDRQTLEPAAEEASYVVERMRDRGVLLSTDGPLHNVLKIKPPLVFDQTDADRLVAALGEVLAEDVLDGSREFGRW